MKRTKGKNSRKITDFFHHEQNTQKNEDTNEINTNKTGNKKSSEIKKEENSKEDLGLIEEEDDLDLLINNHQKNEINNKNKKKKVEEINNINHIIQTPSFFININSHSNKDENRNLILLDMTDKKTLKLTQLNLEPKNFNDPNEFNPSFPFQFSKLINIDNITYITGGILNDYLSKLNYNYALGEKKCYKIIFNQKENEIKIDKISSTIYEHQSHNLLYSKNFNTIFLCSGHKQINCEYLNLSEEEPKWKRLYPLQKPRENAIALLYNEKYIFLIGGKNEKGIINEDYDVIDFEIFIDNKVQNCWKTYPFTNKIILEKLFCGILYSKNNIYVFGGYNKNNNLLSSWKINFEHDEEDNSVVFIKEKYDKIFKIKSVENYDKIKNYLKKEKNANSFVYCGQQSFLNYNNFLFNISFGGKLIIIPENLL